MQNLKLVTFDLEIFSGKGPRTVEEILQAYISNLAAHESILFTHTFCIIIIISAFDSTRFTLLLRSKKQWQLKLS